MAPTRKAKGRGGDSPNDTGAGAEAETRLSTEDMVQNCVHYAIVMQPKKAPMKKSDIIKHAMNGQGKDFKDVIPEVAETLENIFGFELVALRLDSGPGGDVATVDSLIDPKVNHFIVTSQFNNSLVNLARQDSSMDEELRTTALRILLASLYIVNRDIDEDYIWQVLENMPCKNVLCERQDDLRKALKTEAVDSLYLKRTETKSADGSAFRYTWGLRAELECDKYEMLKSIAQIMRKPVHTFAKQYMELLSDDRYRERIEMEKRESEKTKSNARDVSGDGAEQDVEEPELEEIPDNTQTSQQRRRTLRIRT